MTDGKNISNKANQAFEQVRKDIDQVDSELVHLIARRQALTGKVGTLKAELKLPLYVPSRESELIENKRQLAEQKDVSPDLVEDVIRRIMRDSYLSQNKTRSKVSQTQQRKVVIIGGQGQLGSLFVQLFEQSGYRVDIIDKDDWQQSKPLLKKASLVMVAVPIRVTNQVIEKLSDLDEQCLLVDITSIKESPLDAMLVAHKGPVVGLHPMFGPGIKHLAKQTIVVCHGRGEQQSKWFIEQLQTWGANLSFVDASQHDQLMSIVQVLRHFSTIAYGYHLKQENIDLDKVLELSSPIYRLELSMVGRLFAQDAELYSDIIFSNDKNIPMVKRFLQRMVDLLELLETQDKQKFSELFADVSNWFGEYAEKFLAESNQMLAKASDIKK
jgi:chorismate mutase/prephenate dehydrogenase